MKIKDITKEWKLALSWAVDPNDSPDDYIDWKDYSAYGYDYVSIDGVVYTYGKWGITGVFEGVINDN